MRKILQSNAITSASYKFSTIEKRLLYILFEDINRLNGIEVESIVSNNLEYKVVLDSTQVEEIVSYNHISYVLDAFISLRQKSFFIRNNKGDGFVEVGIIASTNYLDNSVIEITVSHQILPYLTELSKNFTIIDLPTVLSFKSYYTQRFYELCRMYENMGHFYLNINNLRSMLQLPDSYKYNEIIRTVVKVSQAEMEDSFNKSVSDLYFTFEPDIMANKGKTVTRLIIKIISNQNKQQLQIDPSTTSLILELRLLLQKLFFLSEERSCLQTLCANLKKLQISELYEVIQMTTLVCTSQPSKNEKNYFRKVLSEKFSI